MMPVYQESAAFRASQQLMDQLNFQNRATEAPWLRGYGIGFKTVNGTTTRTVAVRVYVDRKLPRNNLDNRPLIPPDIEGVPVDVIAANYQFAVGDLQGSDVIHAENQTGAGRAGIMVVDLPRQGGGQGGGFMFLTAAHVIQVGLAPANRDRVVRMVSRTGDIVGVSLTGERQNWFRDKFLDCGLLAPGAGNPQWEPGIRGDLPPNMRPIGVLDRDKIRLADELVIPLPSNGTLQNISAKVVSRDFSYDIEDPEVPGQLFKMNGHIILETLPSSGREVVRGDSGLLVVDRMGQAAGIIRAVGKIQDAANPLPSSPLVAVVPMSWIVGSLHVWPVARIS